MFHVTWVGISAPLICPTKDNIFLKLFNFHKNPIKKKAAFPFPLLDVSFSQNPTKNKNNSVTIIFLWNKYYKYNFDIFILL